MVSYTLDMPIISGVATTLLFLDDLQCCASCKQFIPWKNYKSIYYNPELCVKKLLLSPSHVFITHFVTRQI